MMNSNRPISVSLLATAAILGLASIAGCSSSADQAKAIEDVIRQDKTLSRSIAAEIGIIDQHWSPSGVISKYTAGLRQIDLSNCPPDFELAFLKHIQAWEALNLQVDHNSGLIGFIKGFFGGAGAAISGTDESAESRVQETWFDVERVALKYRVRLADVENAAASN